MKHVAPEQLAQFVRETLPGTQHVTIKQHLQSCASCTQLVDLYRHITLAGSREALYAPPDGIVRIAKAHFGAQRAALRRPKSLIELVFDSVAQPATAGARRSVVSARQLLYRVGSVYVDMEIDREAVSGRASLVGQMLDSARPERPMADVPVILLNRGRRVARTSSNDNGEFQLEFAMKNDLQLAVEVDPQNPVYLPITVKPVTRSNGSRERKRRVNGNTDKAR